MRRLENRVILVTGAASGIGRATAERLADEGGKLFCVDVQIDAVRELVTAIAARGGEATAQACDVSDERQVAETIAACVDRYGRLDVLCNVAGILRFDHFHDLRTEDWNRVLAVNLTGTFLVCRAALPHLLKTKGNIVNVASTAALAAQPWAAAYAASKGGILALTHTLAIDYVKQGLRVNAVCPGDIQTPIMNAFRLPEGANPKLLRRVMAPMGTGKPEHVAGVIAMLASDDGAFVTGEHIRIDGGTLA
ncbi:MAG TPA: SDR family NAD(P)-dependent oxidoreductase [Candidatus Eisenbacteria bacterium]|nr:SDR family NAD(P)-dependent oxidoreductase [Candidatus Eisenbacteria bacterium]